MTLLYLLLVVLGCLIVLRAVALLFFAEIGRKQDLIKHIYKSGTDFQIAIVIPYLDARKIGPLQELIQALNKQDYPQNRTGIHVVATEETVFGMPDASDLPANVKIWTYPAKHAQQGQATSWLIERLLAAGGPSKLFVFLDADDIVRPDFLRNVTTRAFDCFAMQGYIALKRPPRGFVAQVVALSNRLINRIENAGRFHMGLSCKLLNSGWVVRQELLEMIPFRQGYDIDNLEYTLLLNMNGYRVNWAPNVVIYKDERVNFPGLMKDVAHSFLNRLRLIPRYGAQLLIQGATRLDFNLFEQAWNVIKPPHFIVGLIGISGAAILLVNPLFPASFYYWSIFTLIFWSTQLISLAVARCSFKDVLLFVMATPVVYTIGLFTFPLFTMSALGESFFNMGSKPRKSRVGKRFNEDLEPLPAKAATGKKSRERNTERLLPIFDTDAYEEESPEEARYVPHHPAIASASAVASASGPVDDAADFAMIYEEQVSAPTLSTHRGLPAESLLADGQNRVTLPITNGRNAVECTLDAYKETDVVGSNTYYLVFQYKSLAFTTQRYRMLDQAYYELQTKLQAKGFTIVSCGSCAYFYRGTGEDATLEHGFCLSGKSGQPVNADDAVTVVSPSCQAYTDIAQRQAVVNQWQESLQPQPYSLR